MPKFRTRAVRAAALGMAFAIAAAGCSSSDGGSDGGGTGASAADDAVRLNQIQVVGSHNSYHLIPVDKEEELRRSVIGEAADQMHYEHLPLGEQFGEQRVRQIELDVFVDNKGGKYAEPLLREFVGDGPWHPDVMDKPGLKVFHIQDVDYDTTCLTLEDCLTQVKTWSDANEGHVPIAILLELKDTPLDFPGFEFQVPEPFDKAALDELDTTIRKVFKPEDMITPDDVRGDHKTLEEAVLTGTAWPTLADSRGKVIFLMDNAGDIRSRYLEGHPSNEGRPVFTNGEPGTPNAAFVKMNDSMETKQIQDLVRKGYVVRTRSDGDTLEARDDDTSKRDAAFASGAQWVSTDYPMPDVAVGFTTDFVVQVPGGTVARCNPISAPKSCVSADLDLVGK